MYCTHCGAPNDESSTTCTGCKATLFRPGSPTRPSQAAGIPNYLVQSILVTLCCCMIPGIVAISSAKRERENADFHTSRNAT